MDINIANTGITVGTVLALLGSGVGVSIVAEIIKKVFKLNSGKVIQFLVVALSTVTAGLSYLITILHGNPAIAAGHAAEILGVANAAHTFIVSDLSAFVTKVKAYNADPKTTTTTVTSNPSPTTEVVTAPTAAPTPPTPTF